MLLSSRGNQITYSQTFFEHHSQRPHMHFWKSFKRPLGLILFENLYSKKYGMKIQRFNGTVFSWKVFGHKVLIMIWRKIGEVISTWITLARPKIVWWIERWSSLYQFRCIFQHIPLELFFEWVRKRDLTFASC